MKKEVIKIISD